MAVKIVFTVAAVAVILLAAYTDGMVTCEPNLKIVQGCQLCVCQPDGSAAKCENKPCKDGKMTNPPKDAVLDGMCKPGSKFEIKDQCSKCKCHSSGTSFGCEEIKGCLSKNNDSGFKMSDYLPFELPGMGHLN